MSADQPPGVRYSHEVGPGDAGIRITLRRRLPDGVLGDVLGELLSWADGVVRVRSRDGVVHEVADVDVVATRRIPPPPARR